MPSKKKDRHFINGEELVLDLPATFIDVCCDCNLAHFRFLYLEDKKLVVKTFRDDFITKKLKSK